MSRSPHRKLTRFSALLGLSAALGSCVGTPLPEPPDELPRPDFANLFAPVAYPAMGTVKPTVYIVTNPAAVRPGTTVWIVNLDSSDPPIEKTADATGAFNSGPIVVEGNQRLRIVSRTDLMHSAPLDLRALANDSGLVDASTMQPQLTVAQLPDQGLACLRVTPAETLVLQGARARLQLDNRCSVAVDITRAALRLGDQGLRISTAPTSLRAGESGVIELADETGPGAHERLDIVLLDVATTDGQMTGRYAVDVFTDVK